MVSLEEARYWEMRLQTGLDADYDMWLDKRLVEEDPLSELVTDLAFCRSNRAETLHYLHEYTVDKSIDEDTLFTLVWQYLHDLYVEGQMENGALINAMYALAEASGNIHEEPWHSMDAIGILYEEAEDGYLDKAAVHRAIEEYLLNRQPLPFDELYISGTAKDPCANVAATWLVVGIAGVFIGCVPAITGLIFNLLSLKPWDMVCTLGGLAACLPLFILAIILGIKAKR